MKKSSAPGTIIIAAYKGRFAIFAHITVNTTRPEIMANKLKTRMLLADDISLSLKDSLSVRKSTPGDLTRLQEIFSLAREFMAQSGNPSQWSPDYPGEALLLSEIGSEDSYVVEHRGRVIATFVLREGEDPTYKVIYEGEWLDKGPYATIHRIAYDGSERLAYQYVSEASEDHKDSN